MPLIVNGVEIENLIVINTATGEQVEIETLQDQLGNILFQKQTAPEWFNYTGIDANGNYEGTSAYDGVAVAYGIGKPTITVATDGTETIGWSNGNAINDDYYTAIYGSDYKRTWDGESSPPTKVVEDDAVIPDTYKGKPITHLLQRSFMAFSYDSNSSGYRWSQAAYYKTITLGNNITTIEKGALQNLQIRKIILPKSVTNISARAIYTENWHELVDYMAVGGIISISSNIQTTETEGLYNYVNYIIFENTVTEVTNPVTANHRQTGNAGPAGGRKLVFKHSQSAPITITYTSKPKTAFDLTIYTDNDAVKAYDWSANANATVTFYPLSNYKE